MIQYILMHKNDPCGSVAFDEVSGRIIGYRDANTGKSPFLGTMDFTKMQKWWEMRAVPASRKMIREAIRNANCLNSEAYLAKNLALSMTDHYWLCPVEMELKYEDVKFSKLATYDDGKIPYHNATSYDPNASLGGQMEKYWEFSSDGPTLVKVSSLFGGQQSLNEAVATYMHKCLDAEVPYVEYTAVVSADNISCRCRPFTSDKLEFVPAYEVLESQKNRNDKALYDQYIDICVERGISRDIMQRYMDYQTLTDFIISNTDEHLLNFGILRDSDTMEFVAPAPIFDSGNSMFYNETRTVPFSRTELLQRKITGLYSAEEKFLGKVKDRNIVDLERLPSSKELKETYQESGIPEKKTNFIVKNYETKIQMARDFQRGIAISLYHEKQAEKRRERNSTNQQVVPKFIMICGIPGSGKTLQSEKLLRDFQIAGQTLVNPKDLYPLDFLNDYNRFIVNKKALDQKIETAPALKNSVTLISANKTREELKNAGFSPNNDIVFSVIDMRIKAALLRKANIIYEATNVDASVRQHFIELVDSVGKAEKILYIMDADPSHVNTEVSSQKVDEMYDVLHHMYPSVSEGWNDIQEVKDHELSIRAVDEISIDEENIRF